MISTLVAIVLLLLSLLFVVFRKTYNYLPVREMKRRAEQHDPLASRLYPAVAYGSSLRELLLAAIVLSSGGGFVLLCRSVPVWLSLVLVVGLLWLAFAWMPHTRVTSLNAKITSAATPLVAWTVSTMYPALYRSAGIVEKYRTPVAHTGLFDRSDLIELIERQQRQDDSRLSDEELEIVKRTLLFDVMKVSGCMTPAKEIKTILATDVIGPILINELHEHGQEVVLVRESPKGGIVGSLAFRQLDLKATGTVRSAMDTRVYYVHEDDSLTEALHAFFVTNFPLFVVTNKDEDYIGVITVQDILRELLGHVPGSDFDQYADVRAVAAKHTHHRHEETEDDTVVQNSEKVIE